MYPTAEEMFAEFGARRRPDRRADTPAHRHHAQGARGRSSGVVREAVRAGARRRPERQANSQAEQGLALQIAYWRRFVPQLTTLRSDLADGKYGAVHFLVCSQWDEAPPPWPSAVTAAVSTSTWVSTKSTKRCGCSARISPDVKAQVFPTTEDPGAENDVDSAQALVMLSGGTSTVISLGRFYEGGDIVAVELFGSRGHTRFDVVSPETGKDPQLHALKLQAEAFARHARGAAPEGATAEEAARVLELAHGLTEAAGIAVVVEHPKPCCVLEVRCQRRCQNAVCQIDGTWCAGQIVRRTSQLTPC